MKRALRWVAGLLLLLVVAAAVFLFRGDIPAAEIDAKYSNAASRFLISPGGARIHYRDQGNPAGLPIVLIHGAMASLHTWEGWVAQLGDTYRVVTLDLPGHGLTGQVADADYSAAAFTRSISAVVDELNLPRFVLGGNSMGGGATWRYALAHPERVMAMILIDSVPPNRDWQTESAQPPESADDDGPILFKLLNQAWFRAIARYLDPKPLVGQGLRSAYNNSPVVDAELIDRYYELSLRSGTREAILQRSQRIRDDSTASELDKLNMPTLIMWGAQDALIPVSVVAVFEAELADTSTVIYDDLGHVPMEEAPARSAADVRAFLRRALPTAAADAGP